MRKPIVIAAFIAASVISGAGPFVHPNTPDQQHLTPAALNPACASNANSTLAMSFAADGGLNRVASRGSMKPDTNDPAPVAQAPEPSQPESRTKIRPKLREHADELAATAERIEPIHREAAEKLAHWIAANDRPGQALEVIVVCTGNSRRSILGSSMGNLAAAYHGMPEIRFHSGGTDPTAFDPRTVATLKSIGFEIEPTGQEAPRGEPDRANPIYRVSWAQGFEMEEFSKRYSDRSNPRTGFAALMVCSEADKGCPVVSGAAIRLSMPFADPKAFDGGAFETAKYAERRDDIGRVMLFAMNQARAEIRSKSKKIP